MQNRSYRIRRRRQSGVVKSTATRGAYNEAETITKAFNVNIYVCMCFLTSCAPLGSYTLEQLQQRIFSAELHFTHTSHTAKKQGADAKRWWGKRGGKSWCNAHKCWCRACERASGKSKQTKIKLSKSVRKCVQA